MTGVLVAKSNKQGDKKSPDMSEPTVGGPTVPPLEGAVRPAQVKGAPKTVKLFELHTRQLSELAREEDLEGGAAEAFDKHFGALLHNKLIAAKALRLKKLQDEARD